MALQNALAQVAVGKQTAKASAATLAYQHGILSGSPIDVEYEQNVDEATSASRQKTNAVRESVTPKFGYSVRCHKASIGTYLMGLFGTVATTGAGDPYTHVFTPADTVPYLTIASRRGGGNVECQRLTDSVVNEGEFSWEGNKPLELALSGYGCTLLPTFTPWVAGTLDETYLATFLVPVGGTFKIKGVGAAATASIVAGSVKVTNGAEAEIISGALTPNDVPIAGAEFEVGFTVRVDNFALWREILTATTTGTTIAGVQYGGFEVIFQENLNAASTVELKLEGARVPFECELPEVDPGGGPVELELSGIPLYDGTNAAVKATLVNAVAAY